MLPGTNITGTATSGAAGTYINLQAGHREVVRVSQVMIPEVVVLTSSLLHGQGAYEQLKTPIPERLYYSCPFSPKFVTFVWNWNQVILL